MISTTTYPYNALAQNWTVGDAVISEGKSLQKSSPLIVLPTGLYAQRVLAFSL
ncbi:hypothetical protein ADU37_CDS07960 [Thermococcus sp. 2319x1]|nr:hypothetical protein ADU37_CDS07960 [Thermococcus sp. 2319x1]